MELDFSKKVYPQVKFKTGVITCPVCARKHPYWCSVTLDDGLCLCRYEPSEKVATDGRFIHQLKTSSVISNQEFVKSDKGRVEKTVADIERLDAVYSAFLGSLEFKESHRHNLINERGMLESSIVKNGYASVPESEQRFKVVQSLSESFDLSGIPGFYQESGKWVLHLTYSGFYVPFRDERGRIAGMQIRRDEPVKNKYLWFSSDKKATGAKSTNPIHVANFEAIRKYKNVFLTEGALKADIVANFTEAGLVAIGGVSSVNPDKLIDKISNSLPEVEKIVVAFDMDWQVKDEVRGAIFRLTEKLKNSSYKTLALTWDLNLGKGLDDILKYASDKDIHINDVFTFLSVEDFQKELLAFEENEEKVAAENKESNVVNESENANLDMGLKSEIAGQKSVLGISCRDLLKTELPRPERVMFGINRGTIGMMVATTNIGKTTLALNLSLSAGMNKPFLPLFEGNDTGRRVMYIDGEASKSELKEDIKTMMESCSVPQKELIMDNLYFICDEEIFDEELNDKEVGYEPLDLVKSTHLETVIRKANEFKPDLIIVDTLSALMTVEDENDNAKMNRDVIVPMKRLAHRTNAGVLILHHTGKYQEGSQQPVSSYTARGASVLGGLSRANFILTKGMGKYEGMVTLSSPKVKGDNFEPVVLKLDTETRWFRYVEKQSQDKNSKPKTKVSKKESNYKKVIDFVKDSIFNTGDGLPRKLIIDAFKGTMDRNIIDAIFKEADKNGDLYKPKYGHYAVTPKYLKSETEMPMAE